MNEEKIMAEVLASKKYRNVDRSLIARLIAREAPKYKKEKDAVKSVKNALHQVFASFMPPDALEGARQLLEGYAEETPLLENAEFSRLLLARHASTKERLPHIDAFYDFVRSYAPAPASVLDVGCGFHPFAIPWISRDAALRYAAFDIDGGAMALLNRYFERAGLAAASARTLDAVREAPEGRYDLAFLLKLVPVLEQQQKGRAFALIEALEAAHIVVSFPIRSLSGREKGMQAYYSEFFEKGLPPSRVIAGKAVIGNELVYSVKAV